MTLDIRRATVTDAKAVADFMREQLITDPLADHYGNPDDVTTKSMERTIANGFTWLAFEKKDIVGVLIRVGVGYITHEGQVRTCGWFLLRAAALPKEQRVQVSKAMSIWVYDDLVASGEMTECIAWYGPTASGGAVWGRALKLPETVKDGVSHFCDFSPKVKAGMDAVAVVP